MDPVISVEGLKKAYGSTVAVQDISIEVRAGEIFGLLGPNGAGKTTTVECLQGLRRADGGRISVLGLDPRTQGRELRVRIGSQLQESALPDRIKVWEALDLFATLTRGDVDWELLIRQWGLADKRDTKFHDLSGGQRQRLFVALALVNEPELVFLDEMTTGLDPAGRRVAWELIEAIRARGTTVVLVTHFMDEAERLCDRVAVVAAGRVVDVDTPQSLIARHGGTSRIRFSCAGQDLSWVRGIPHVRGLSQREAVVEIEGEGAAAALVIAGLVRRGIVPDDLTVERSTLEDVFLFLTEDT